MINKIWFWLLFTGLIYGFGKAAYYQINGIEPPSAPEVSAKKNDHAPSKPAKPSVAKATEKKKDSTKKQKATQKTSPIHDAGKRMTEAATNGAKTAVTVCLGLIGVMVLWLGMLNIAKDAGMVDALARLLRPFMRWLFPEVPDGHPAQGAMLMNISANMLGMGNAATPLGLKAMQELQTLNPTKDTATNAMATFLAMNTSSVTLLPMTLIALRVSEGSSSPASPLFGVILATFFSTFVAIIAVRFLSKLPRYAMPKPVIDNSETDTQTKTDEVQS